MSIKSEELLSWYLAVLRKNIREDAAKLTPMTLVETDQKLVQEIVSSTESAEKERNLLVLSIIKARSGPTRILHNLIQVLAGIGCALASSILLLALQMRL